MNARLLLCAAVALIHTSSLAQIDGHLVLDRTMIPRSAPVSGLLVLSPSADVAVADKLENALSLRRGNIEVQVTSPGGRVRTVDERTGMDGMEVLHGVSAIRHEVLHAGETYIVPFFFLNVNSEFLFGEAGDYEVRVCCRALPGAPCFAAKVSVFDCGDCGRNEFEALFSSRVAIGPFSGGGVAAVPPTITQESVYYDSYAVVAAYQLGGPMIGRFFVNGTQDEIDSTAYFKTSRFASELAEGLKWSGVARIGYDVWKCAELKSLKLKTGATIDTERFRDGKGRVMIMAR